MCEHCRERERLAIETERAYFDERVAAELAEFKRTETLALASALTAAVTPPPAPLALTAGAYEDWADIAPELTALTARADRLYVAVAPAAGGPWLDVLSGMLVTCMPATEAIAHSLAHASVDRYAARHGRARRWLSSRYTDVARRMGQAASMRCARWREARELGAHMDTVAHLRAALREVTRCRGCDKRCVRDDGEQCGNCARCADCCDCPVCRMCGDRVDSVCDNCDRCSDCCECRECGECGDRVSRSEWCSGCERCNDCGCQCDSDDDSDEGSSTYTPREWKKRVGVPHARYPSTRCCGVELEAYSVNRSKLDWDWIRSVGAGAQDDGSIHGGNGAEIITPPASGDKAVEVITRATELVKAAGGEVNNSCGTHVHIDASDLTHADIVRLIKLWSILEAPHYETQPNARRSSSYAKPCAARYMEALKGGRIDAKGTAKYAVYQDADAPDRQSTKWGSERYHALNLHSWFYRGTIEIRTHSGTLSPEKILPWASYWASVLDWVRTHTDLDVETLRSHSARKVFLSFAPTDECRAYIKGRWRRFGHIKTPAKSTASKRAPTSVVSLPVAPNGFTYARETPPPEPPPGVINGMIITPEER